jgi:propane monooxygenase small subunit
MTHHAALAHEAASNLQPIWSQPRVKVSSFAEAQAATKNRIATICKEVDLRAPV